MQSFQWLVITTRFPNGSPSLQACQPCVWLFVTPWSVAHQTPLSMVFSAQEYWAGCHFLLQGILPNKGLNPCLLPWQGNSFPLSHLESHMSGDWSQWTSQVSEQDPVGCSWNSPYPRPSASAPLWTMKVIVFDADFLSCFSHVNTHYIPNGRC